MPTRTNEVRSTSTDFDTKNSKVPDKNLDSKWRQNFPKRTKRLWWEFKRMLEEILSIHERLRSWSFGGRQGVFGVGLLGSRRHCQGTQDLCCINTCVASTPWCEGCCTFRKTEESTTAGGLLFRTWWVLLMYTYVDCTFDFFLKAVSKKQCPSTHNPFRHSFVSSNSCLSDIL